ncbi:AP-4 complex subunit sigma-1 isoform X3 [Hydra vulgaris]|uniref:AP complex subunit sigma n=1 Tax=Hydra vulgaris TaxID=6087 RepID=A0ABM4CIK9_HYDVU
MIKFLLVVNKQGQTRVSKYYCNDFLKEKRPLFEAEIVRKCFSRAQHQCSFIEYHNFKVVYRRYASLFFLIGIDDQENELGIFEFIHNFVQVLDKYLQEKFQKSVSELDIMFNLEVVHMILGEMICNGYIIETNHSRILAPILAVDKLN